MFLSVVNANNKFTGVQYKQDNENIRNHHLSQGEFLVWLDYPLTNQGTEENEDYGQYQEGMECRPLGKTQKEEIQELKELIADLTQEVLLGD